AHSLADLGVAKIGMARQILGYQARRARLVFGNHAHGRADLTGRAIAALESVMMHEGGLHRMQSFAVREAFDRPYRVALMEHGQCQTRIYATAANQHGAGPALSV